MRFFSIGETSTGHPLAVCVECACVVADDDEGANRRDHEDFHLKIDSHEPWETE